MVYHLSHVDAHQGIPTDNVSAEIIVILTPAEMVVHASIIYIHTHVIALQHSLDLIVTTELDGSRYMHIMEGGFQIKMGGGLAIVTPTWMLQYTITLDSRSEGLHVMFQRTKIQYGISGFTLLTGVHGGGLL